jgi:hypothetical protein
MTDIVERLRKLAEDLIALDLDMRLPPGSLNPHFAADEIERLRAGYERLARHIAPDVEAEYIWSHLPEQIIDAGLQIQESALSEARATGRREGMEEAAKWNDEQARILEQLVSENEAFERTLGIKMRAENESYRNQQATHKKSAAAIRAAMEKS